MKFLVGLALCFASIFVVADATSLGAPPAACDNLTPGSPHGTTEQPDPNPWMIDISSFDNGTGAYYIPGYTYNVTLRLVNEASTMTYRGFFIQGRTELTNMMVGTFNDPAGYNVNTRLSMCTTPSVGVTHNNPSPRVEFSDPLSFSWVAPAAGTGPILFRYSVVQIQPTWWANDASAVVQEAPGEAQSEAPSAATSEAPVPGNGAQQLQGVGQWTLLMVTAVLTISLKAVL